MPADPNLSAVHFRVISAGQAIEGAIDSLRSRPVPRVFQARVSVSRAVSDLRRCADYLRQSGSNPNLLAYTEKLAAFYQGLGGKIARPAGAPAVADELYAAQALLLSADPYGPSSPSG